MPDITITITEAEAERFRDALETGAAYFQNEADDAEADAEERDGDPRFSIRYAAVVRRHAAALRELAARLQPSP
jgi:hypothetical protein